ncbi:recQ-mediated genome instability protein 1-like [Ctenocephalides felis]|uniref:recQ-mediated genome instability protein 1-like n=1 Tax=Ctenocephalides felis TaxID=7515 RepID=UPI000E6E5780|nr:recQ-mediated genome instability protein 1-like [Ctenocephalides felis]
MLSNQVNNVKKWFNEKHIKIQDIWLTQCVEYFLSENQNMSLQNLQEEAFQQWLLNDLADTTSNSLPELDKTTKVLPGSFVLQIQKLIDISASAYSQIQKLYNLPVEQTEEEMEKEKSSRVLKLFLSDGTKEIQAMEYRQIKCLSLNTAPGSKIILKGPINVSSSGMLYLENHHVTFLGGEVETLLEPNSVINTLLKSINLSADSSLLKNNRNIAIKPLQSEIIDSNTREASTISTSSNTNVVNNFETNILLDDPLADAFLEEFDLHNINDAPDVDLDKTFMRVQVFIFIDCI